MNSAILVIDVQDILFKPAPTPHASQRVIEQINSLTSWARQSELPVIFIQHEKALSEIAFGTVGWQLDERLTRSDDDLYVRKTTPNSFLHTDLENLLAENEISHLYVCGYASEFCIDTTVRAAAGLGFSVTLVADAHTTHDKDHLSAENIIAHHNATLPNITSFGVKLNAVKTQNILLDSVGV
jgi:nicotinamidase-related amidase